MKLIKTLPALFALALLGGCANSQCCDDTTTSEAQAAPEGCKAEGAKPACCEAGKTEAKCEAKSEATTETKPAQKN